MTPFNQLAHGYLIAVGYDYRHVPKDYWDNGGAENGPQFTGHAAYDEYSRIVETLSDGTRIVEYVYLDGRGSFTEIIPEMGPFDI